MKRKQTCNRKKKQKIYFTNNIISISWQEALRKNFDPTLLKEICLPSSEMRMISYKFIDKQFKSQAPEWDTELIFCLFVFFFSDSTSSNSKIFYVSKGLVTGNFQNCFKLWKLTGQIFNGIPKFFLSLHGIKLKSIKSFTFNYFSIILFS